VDNVEDSVRGVREHFDAFGAGEWDRLDESPSTRVALELHRRFLARFILPPGPVSSAGSVRRERNHLLEGGAVLPGNAGLGDDAE